MNAEFPKGDGGGNGFTLPYHYNVEKLHALWDNVIYENRASVKMPFTEEKWVEFGQEVDELLSKHSISDEEILL